jgi:quercetin dioxygenase-like cupin family protein
MRYALLLVAAILPLGALAAQESQSPSAQPRQAHVITPEQLNWGPAPAILPAGARLAVLDGDPTKAGPFTMRLAMPAGYRIPPHFHQVDEHVTVISGAFQVGMGDTFDEGKLTTLSPGTFGVIPPGMRHFARADKATVIQLHGVGPWGLTYVNPADQPNTPSR